MGKRAAKAKEVVGYATGDREVEAKGRVDERARPESEVAEEELEVRKEHGEFQPGRLRESRRA